MKLSIFLFFLVMSFTSCSQTNKYVGEYVFDHSSGIVQRYKLTLDANGTFEFEQNWAQLGISNEIQDTGTEKGKGSWTFKNKWIVLRCNRATDLTQDYRLDFDNTKVRILNDSIIRFTESKLFWIENMDLKKRI